MKDSQPRLRAAAIHLAISATVAALAAALVFGLWYPWPYREISGGRELFLIVTTVDVMLGPLLTLVIFSRGKPLRELRLDLAVIGLVQIAGLAYGLWTVFVARPVYLAFEYDRFRVVHAIEVPEELLGRAPASLQTLPAMGPGVVALRAFVNDEEKINATLVAIRGIPLGARPDLWRPYADARDEVLRVAKPLSVLQSRFPADKERLAEAVRATGRAVDQLAWVPMAGRKQFWTALVDRQSAQVLGFLALDSF